MPKLAHLIYGVIKSEQHLMQILIIQHQGKFLRIPHVFMYQFITQIAHI